MGRGVVGLIEVGEFFELGSLVFVEVLSLKVTIIPLNLVTQEGGDFTLFSDVHQRQFVGRS
jgi:hypothetical protein